MEKDAFQDEVLFYHAGEESLPNPGRTGDVIEKLTMEEGSQRCSCTEMRPWSSTIPKRTGKKKYSSKQELVCLEQARSIL